MNSRWLERLNMARTWMLGVALLLTAMAWLAKN